MIYSIHDAVRSRREAPRRLLGGLTLKTANALARVWPLERRAFSLDYGVNPEDLTDQQILRLWNREQELKAEEG